MKVRVRSEKVNGVVRHYPQKRVWWWWNEFTKKTPAGFSVGIWFTTYKEAYNFAIKQGGTFI